MSLNEEKDGEDPNKLVVPQNVEDDLIHVIHVSLSNISTQVDNLNKNAEGILGILSKEINNVSCKYSTLQEHVIQLNNNLTAKDTQKECFLQAKNSKSFQSVSVQTDLDYQSNPLPAKICETRDACVQTLPLYMANLPCQDVQQVLLVPNFKEDTKSVMIPYVHDEKADPMILHCQDNEQDLIIPYCLDSDHGLVVSPARLEYVETLQENFTTGINEQVQEKYRKNNEHIDHPIEPKSMPQFTLMGNDCSTVDHFPPTYIEIPHSHMNPSAECSAFLNYPINEISKVLTQAVGKVLSCPTCPQRKEFSCLRSSESYFRYGIEKGEMKAQAQVENHPKLEAFVSPTPPASPSSSLSDWSPVLIDSKTESPASKIHSQSQFPSTVLRASAFRHLHNYLQTGPEVVIKTIEENDYDFEFVSPSSECYEILSHHLLNKDNEKERIPTISTSPVLLRRIEAEDKDSDLLVHTSFIQSPPSLGYSPQRPSFSKSPKLSVSKSPSPSALPTLRSLHQPSTRYTGSTCSKLSSATLQKHSSLETYQISVSPSESFSQSSRSSVAPARSIYSSKLSVSPKPSVSPRRVDTQVSRFSVPSSSKYIEQSTENLIPPSKQTSSLKSAKSFNLQSFSLPKSTPSSLQSPQTLSMLQYSVDPVSLHPIPTLDFNKERSTLMESMKKGVLLRKTEERCILKAQIEISKK